MESLITISVTDDDLANGKPGNSEEDAIALAARRLFPAAKVFACPAILIVRQQGCPDVWYSLPPEARELMELLDHGHWDQVVPITFTATHTRFELRRKAHASR